MALEEPQAIAVTENNVTESFNINVGIRQGEVLSVVSFSLVLDYILKKSYVRGKYINKILLQINAYVDDVLIIFMNLQVLEKSITGIG